MMVVPRGGAHTPMPSSAVAPTQRASANTTVTPVAVDERIQENGNLGHGMPASTGPLADAPVNVGQDAEEREPNARAKRYEPTLELLEPTRVVADGVEQRQGQSGSAHVR
jgi:hypothetical protein